MASWSMSKAPAAPAPSMRPKPRAPPRPISPMPGSRPSPPKRSANVLALAVTTLLAAPAAADALRPYRIVGAAIPDSLTGAPGDAAHGRAIVVNRQLGLCLLCHSGPFPEEKFQGNLAPSLAGAGKRWNEGELRLRIVDASRLNPDSIMPSYYRTLRPTRGAPAFAGKPLLSAEQIEDVVAYLKSLDQ